MQRIAGREYAVRYDAVVCGARRGRLEATRGYDLHLLHGLSALQRADTIVIPGVDDFDRPVEPAVRCSAHTHVVLASRASAPGALCSPPPD